MDDSKHGGHDRDRRIEQLRNDGVNGTFSETAIKVIGDLSDDEFRHLRSIRKIALREGAPQTDCDHFICACV